MEEIERILTEKITLDIKQPVLQVENDQLAAAVLILLVKMDQEWNIVYTRRTNGVRTHQGEVSFPGGAFEYSDKSLIYTALRETKEEIGISPSCVRILGGLPPLKTVSNYLVYPFVGVMDHLIEFKINLLEVEKVFLIPIPWLMDRKNSYEKAHRIGENVFRKVIHYHEYDGEHLWGLTARITQDVLALIK